MEKNESSKKKIPTKSRTILWYMIFTGCMIDAMIRVDTNLTIVDMVSRNSTHNNNNNNINSTNNYNHERFSFERYFLDKFNIEYSKNGFLWNEYEQGILLGSFYWLHWLTQIPGGIFAQRYGTKMVSGIIVLTGSIISFFMPICAFIDYRIFMFMRMLQGMLIGMMLPAYQSMIGKWIPANERSKFLTAYMGFGVGISIFAPIFGIVISKSTWEWPYYICGIYGLIWSILWYYFVYNTPGQHPRIDKREKDYIENSLGNSDQTVTKLSSIPWKLICTSRSVFIISIYQTGSALCLITMTTTMPTYFNEIHNFSLDKFGIIASISYILKLIYSWLNSMFADYLLSTGKLSRTNTRKLNGAIVGIGQGLSIIAIGLTGYSTVMATMFYILTTILHGASTAGSMANSVDISPKFAGIILGLTLTIASSTGFLSPYIVGVLTLNNQTQGQWQQAFYISGSISIVSGIIYVLFAKAELENWDTVNKKKDEVNNDDISLSVITKL